MRNEELGMKNLVKTLLIFLAIVSAGCTGKGSGNGRNGHNGRAQITVTVYDRGNVPAAEGTIEKNRWTRWINENGPVDVTFVAIPRVNPQEKLNTLFA